MRVRMTVGQIKAAASADVDPVKVQATSGNEIRRHAIEDGENPDTIDAPGHAVIPPPRSARKLA